MAGLFDIEIDLSCGNAGLPRGSFKDWMRVRLLGHSEPRKLVVPLVVGSVYFKNDGFDDVEIRRGPALPVTISRGECVHVMFNDNDMWKV